MRRGLRHVRGVPVALLLAIAWGVLGGRAEVWAQAPASRKASSETRRQRDLRAYESFLAGRLQESLELTTALYADFPEPVYLRNLARCHQRLEHPDAAIHYFREYLAKAQGLDKAQVAEVTGFIRQMEELKRNRGRTAATDATTPTVTDLSTRPAQPSTATKQVDDPWAEKATEAETEPTPAAPKAAVVASPTTAEEPGLSRGAALGLAASLGTVGVAAVVVGSVFGLQAKARADQSNAECAMNACSLNGKYFRDEAFRKAELSTIAFVAGGVFLGTSLYFLLSAPPAQRERATLTARAPRLDPRISDHGALLLVGGEF